MQKISRERFEWLKQKHYELWDWLSKNPDKYKNDWFDLDKNRGIRARNNCFACQFKRDIKVADIDCDEGVCPLIWNETNKRECLGGLYKAYCNAHSDYSICPQDKEASRAEVIKYAKQIRDLPWSEEYVEDEEMNNENYIVINGKKAELTEEQLRQLGIEVDKDKRWRAEEGKKYWRVSSGNKVISDIEADIEQDDYFYDTHNYFKTKEEAEEYAEVLEIKGQLMKFADEHNEFVNWSDATTSKYHLEYRLDLGGIVVVSACWLKYPEVIYFSSKEIAKQAIDTIGEENIIKYLTYNY